MSADNEKTDSRGALLKAYFANFALISNVLRKFQIREVELSDLTQETILRALEAAERTQIQEPKRFLLGIAKNIARSEIQKLATRKMDLLDDFDLKTYVADEPAVDDIVDSQFRWRTFGAAVGSLPPQCQKVFILKYVYGASHKEIADKLGIALSTVEKHVALGIKRCREEMLRVQNVDEDADSGASVLEPEQWRR